VSWKGFRRGWRELRQRELSWRVLKGSWDEFEHPPRREITPEERAQRARRSELGFPLFLLHDAERDEVRPRQEPRARENK
jgi:hypothetical protein